MTGFNNSIVTIDMFSQYVCTSIWAGDEVQVLNTYDVSMYLYGRTQYKQYHMMYKCIYMDVHNANNINHYVFKVPIVHNTI